MYLHKLGYAGDCYDASTSIRVPFCVASGFGAGSVRNAFATAEPVVGFALIAVLAVLAGFRVGAPPLGGAAARGLRVAAHTETVATSVDAETLATGPAMHCGRNWSL